MVSCLTPTGGVLEPLDFHLILFIDAILAPSASRITLLISFTLPPSSTGPGVPAFPTLTRERNSVQPSSTKDSLAVAFGATDEFSPPLICIFSCQGGDPESWGPRDTDGAQTRLSSAKAVRMQLDFMPASLCIRPPTCVLLSSETVREPLQVGFLWTQ